MFHSAENGCPFRHLVLPVLLCGLISPASAQLFERPTLIKGARIVTMDGKTLEKGDILIKGDRIQQVAPSVELGFGEMLTAKIIEAGGKTITPGFVDAWSALGRDGAAINPDATGTAWDAFDPYMDDELREALRSGVTSVYLGPGGKPGIVGGSVVVRLAPSDEGGIGQPAKKDAALCMNLGSEQATLARVKTFTDLRKKFRTAVEYRKSLEDYEEELKEYEKKLEERKKKEAEADKSGKEEKPKDESKQESDKPKEGEPAPKPKEEEKPKPDKSSDADVLSWSDLAKGDPPPGGPKEKGKEGEKKDEKKEDELKKPTKPKQDPSSEALLKAIDHEIPVRIEAHRSSDILNAISLAKEYNFDLILEGATEAYLVAEEIAEAKAPVVLGQIVRTDLYEANEFRRHSERNAAELSRAGVDWAVGSGGDDPRAARFVSLNAQLAAANDPATSGHGPEAWMYAITAGAAKVLGLSEVGRVARGMKADLLIWNGDPADPAARLERVLVSGEVVYEAKEGS